MADLEQGGGQVVADSPTGTTAPAPIATDSGSGGQTPTTPTGTAEAIESFFDPSSIADKPELQAAYKQMQGAFTKRMQDFAAHRPKIEAYEQFSKDPLGTMQQLAARMGYKLVQPSAEQKAQDWNPQSWDDVMSEAEKRVLKRMEPVYNELRDLKKQSVEKYLDDKFIDWRSYEDDMLRTLQSHPSLANDPDALYKLSVPSEVWEARATKAAMEKLRAKQEHSGVAGESKTTRPTAPQPSGPLTFDQAIEAARAKLAKAGLRPT